MPYALIESSERVLVTSLIGGLLVVMVLSLIPMVPPVAALVAAMAYFALVMQTYESPIYELRHNSSDYGKCRVIHLLLCIAATAIAANILYATGFHVGWSYAVAMALYFVGMVGSIFLD